MTAEINATREAVHKLLKVHMAYFKTLHRLNAEGVDVIAELEEAKKSWYDTKWFLEELLLPDDFEDPTK